MLRKLDSGEELHTAHPAVVTVGCHFFALAWYSYPMSESLEGMTVQRVESAREQHEREAARVIAEKYRALVVRADERLRAEPIFRRVELRETS